MNIKRSLSLLVVAVISISFATLSLLFAYNQYVLLKQHAFAEAMVNMKNILLVSQARFDREFRNQDMASVEREVMALNLLEDVILLKRCMRVVNLRKFLRKKESIIKNNSI